MKIYVVSLIKHPHYNYPYSKQDVKHYLVGVFHDRRKAYESLIDFVFQEELFDVELYNDNMHKNEEEFNDEEEVKEILKVQYDDYPEEFDFNEIFNRGSPKYEAEWHCKIQDIIVE